MNQGPATPRPRRGVVFTLIAVASLVGFLAVFAVWAKRQLLETETWTETSTELLKDEDIEAAVATFTVDALFTNVPVEERIHRDPAPSDGAPAVSLVLLHPAGTVLPWAKRMPAGMIAAVAASLLFAAGGFVLSVEMDWPLSQSVGGVGFCALLVSHLIAVAARRA